MNWLRNLAGTALDSTETAVILIARMAPDDFIALPLKLNSRNRSASSLSTFYSSNYSPVVHTPRPAILLHALFQHLARREKMATITISPMDSASPIFAQLKDALNRSDWNGVHSFFCFGNWIHDLGGDSYQNYLAARSSRLRNTVARRTRKFVGSEHGKLALITGGNNLEQAIEQFISIYNQSWKRQEPFPEFIPQLLRLAATHGWLRLGIASHEGKPIAGQIWFVWQGTAYIFKLAYHEEYKHLSPGTVLTAFMMEHVIDRDGVSRIDYLSGDDAYKKDWMSSRGEKHGLAAYNIRSLRGSAMFLARAANTFVKKVAGKKPA
ncbi:MAG: GNAT family N-acetyltransferase [Halioglobus sp.]